MNTGLKNLRISTLLVGFLALWSSFTALATNMKTFGDIDVHYMAIGAAFLTPEVAKAYGIQRSRYNGLVNISVLDNSQQSQPAKLVLISGTAKNLAGQNKSLTFDEVKEGQAIYYLAQVNYRNNETIRFSIDIIDGANKHTLKFSQKFFAD